MLSKARIAVMTLALVCAFASTADAQEVNARVGDQNTNSSQTYPLGYVSYYGIRAQLVYSAAELRQAANGALDNGGKLKEIIIRRTSGTMGTYYNFRLRFGNSTRSVTSLDYYAYNNYSGSLSTVLQGSFSPQNVSSNGQNFGRFPFQSQWDWNGTSNICVDISFDRISNSYGFYTPNGSGRYMRYYRGYYYNNIYNYNYLSSQDSASNLDIQFIFEVKGLNVTASPGSYEDEYADEQGTNDEGFSAGTFTIESGSITGPSMTDIQIKESGSADAQQAISQVGLFRDNGNNNFDSSDTQIGSWTQFNGADGTADFTVQTGEQQFGANEERRYHIVLKLSGSGVPPNTLDFGVEDVTTATDTIGIGFPTPTAQTIRGVQLLIPDLSVTDMSPSTAGTAEMASQNNVIHTIEVDYPDGPENDIGSITLQASGTGDDGRAIPAVKLWRDLDDDGMFDAQQDEQLAQSSFSGNDGMVTLNVSPADSTLPKGDTQLFFVTVDFNTNGSHGDTFSTQITDIGGTLPGTNIIGVPTPSGSANAGLILQNPLNVQWHGPLNARGADSSESGLLIADFSVTAEVMDWEVSAIVARASGSLNDSFSFNRLQLMEDTNNNGSFDGEDTDMPAAFASVAFGSDDGLLSIVPTQSTFRMGVERRFFLIADFSGLANSGQTFLVRVEDVIGTPALGGGATTNVPTASSGQVTIGGANLRMTVNGPNAAESIANNEVGETGQGVVLMDFSVTSSNATRSIGDITFKAVGTGDDSTAFTEIALYEDFNDNGMFDGTPIDRLACTNPEVAFSQNDGTYTATLVDSEVNAGQPRRFFLAVKFAGTALATHTFNARVTAWTVSSGFQTGVPSLQTTSFVVGSPVLTVGNAPDAPENHGRIKNGAFSHTLAKYRMTASNADITVTQLTLSQIGTADWTTTLDATVGLQLWLDDGNGQVDGVGVDGLLYQGTPTSAELVVTLAQPVLVRNDSSVDIFLVANINAQAGGTTPDSYRVAISRPESVTTTASEMVVFGMPEPTSSTLSVVDFFVSSFTPRSVPLLSAGDEIEIVGSGFTSPVTVTIGGIPCNGTASVSTDGTRVTGLKVPYGTPGSHEIVLDSGVLEPQTLSMRFTYGTSSSSGSEALCSLSSGSSDMPWAILLMAASMLALAGIRRRA